MSKDKIWEEINERISQDGLKPTSDDKEKVLHFWELFKTTQSDLQKAMENEEKLKKDQEKEMKEVENYVEHIRHLSDEREALIQELETENETLKAASENKTESSKGPELSSDTKEMLVQQGLEEIAKSTTNEQIAFLLLERARLLDEMEAEQEQPTLSDADTSKELKQILERERTNFDEELRHQRASSTLLEEKLKNEHEEEINNLIEENTILEEDLADEQSKVQHLTTELQRLKDELETERSQRKKEDKDKDDSSSSRDSPRTIVNRPPSPARSSSDLQLRKIIEDKTKLEGELISLRSKIRVLEDETRSKESEASSMKSNVEKINMENERLQVKNQKLKSDLAETETQLDEAETSVERLTKSRDSLTLKVGAMEQELKTLQEDAKKGSTLQDVVDILNRDKKQLEEEVEGLNKRLESSLSSEDELANEKRELISQQQEMNAKMDALSCELNSLKEERETLTEENVQLTHSVSNQNSLLISLKEELDKMTSEREQISEEKNKMVEEHKNAINLLQQTQEQESTKQELIIQHMRDQNQKLTNQISELQTDVQKVKEEQAELLKTNKSLEMSSKETEQRHEEEMEDLKCKLQLTLEELTKSKSVLDRTLGENKDLVNKLTLSGQLDHDYTLLKQDLQNTLDDKSKLEQTIKDLEQKLFDQMQQADDEFEEERAQRIDLEKKLCEYSDLETEIFTVREELENEKREKLELKQSLQEYEDLLEDQKTEHENVQLDLEAKVKCLEKRSQELQDDLFSAQDELQAAIDNTEKANKELEVTKVELSERLSIQPQSIKSVHSAIPVRCNGNIVDNNNRSNKGVENSSNNKLSPSLENQTMPSHMFSDKIEAVTLELTTSKKHLEETLEDVELYKTKLEQLELELDSSHEKLVQSQTTVEQLQNQNEQLLIQKEQLQSQKGQLQELINMSKDETDMVPAPEKPVENDLPVQNLQMAQSLLLAEKQVMEMQTTLEVTKSELSETKDKLKAVELEYCALKTSIDHKQTSSSYDVEEKQQHLDRIKSLEEISHQLEIDNREMAKKLSETLSKTEDIETKLEREKQRNSDNNHLGTRHSRQLEEELDAATKQIRTLREDLHEEQAKVFRLEAENVGQKAKYDSIVTRLETEVADMKEFHRKEMDSLTNKLEASNTEAQELRNEVREKEQELLNQENETARMKSSLDRVEAQVETEIKLRTNMENRNKQQEQEMTKVWAQVRTMMEKCSKLENTKHCLEEELSRLMSSTRQAETIFIQKSASQESNITSLEMRTEQAERKNEKLQRDLDEACKNLKTMEEKVQDTESSHLQLEDQQDFIVKLRNQLESERLQRTLSDQNVAELRHQVTLLKQRESKLSSENRELQHSILDLESRITYLQDEKENDYDMKHQMSESGKQNLMSQIVNLREEVKILQYELLSANEKQEMHEKRYENRKLRTKEKLLKAREYYSTERSRLRDQMEVMDEELRLSRATLRKEAEWRDKMDANYKHILQEKRELITKLTDLEETLRDRTRTLSMSQVRMQHIEEENSRLQVHLESQNNQRSNVKRTNSTKKTDEGDDNDQGEHENSMDSNGWEPDHMGDGAITILNNKSPRFKGKYVSAVVDLYQNDSESEQDQEFEA
ncbi:hypothetical protein SNE40_015676 [Patella caerulea]|uniref:Uncharacterized protein n=1 Tax=Patella caerulea TaxID=87958 RepID=A0AAN8PSE0_PATCE